MIRKTISQFINFNNRYFCTNNNIPTSPNNIKKELEYIYSLIYQGNKCANYGDYLQAEKLSVTGYRFLQKVYHPGSSVYALPQKNLGILALKMGKLDTSVQFLRGALDKSKFQKSSNSSKIHIDVLNNLGLALIRQGKLEEGLKTLFSALEKSKDFKQLLPSIFANIGEYYKGNPLYEKEYINYQVLSHRAIISTSYKTTTDYGRVCLNRSQSYRISGQIDNGKSFFSIGSLILSQQLNKYNINRNNDSAKVFIESGHYDFLDGSYENAINNFESAKMIFKEMGNINTPDSIFNLINIILVQKYLNKPLLDSKSSQDHVNSILESCRPLIQKEKYDYVVKSLKEPINSNSKKIKLINPYHFQLENDEYQ